MPAKYYCTRCVKRLGLEVTVPATSLHVCEGCGVKNYCVGARIKESEN